MNPKNSTKITLTSLCNAIITGLTSLANVDDAVVGGKPYKKAQMLAPLIAYVLLPPLTAIAKIAFSKAVASEKEAAAAARAMVRDVIKPYLQTRFGKNSTELESYGLAPVKTPAKSAAVKAAAVVKGKATRKALGPVTPKQRKAAKAQLPPKPVTA